MSACYQNIVGCVYIFATWIAANGEIPKQYILEDNCDTPILFSESMQLVVFNLSMVETCDVIAQSNYVNKKLLIDFTEFDLVDNCTDTKLNIVDDVDKRIAGPLCGDNLKTTVFRSGGNAVHFQYSSSSPDTLGKHMSVTITSFDMGIEGNCSNDEFKCDNKICIAKDLVCNGINECSDNSDDTPLLCKTTSSPTPTTPNKSSSSTAIPTSTPSGHKPLSPMDIVALGLVVVTQRLVG